MVRSLLLVAFSVMLVGGTCEPPLSCSIPLDGTSLGFTLQLPAGFQCTSELPVQTSLILGFVTYEQDDTGFQLLVFVGDPTAAAQVVDNPGTGGDGNCDDLGAMTSVNGIEFNRCKSVDDGTGQTTYAGTTDLPGGDNFLLILLVADADSTDLADLHTTVLNNVEFP